MTRLENYAVGGYFKTPEQHLQPIASLYARTKHGGRLLDPTAGTGEAVKFYADAWNMTAYANELDIQRAQVCHDLLGSRQAVQGDIFTLRASNNTFDIYLNPPYMWDKEGDEKRRELGMLKHSWKWLRPGGFINWLVYKHHVTLKASQYLAERSNLLDIYALPGLHLGEYKQVLVIARQGQPIGDPTQTAINFFTRVQANDFQELATPLLSPKYEFEPPVRRKHFFFLPDTISHSDAHTNILEDGAQYTAGLQNIVELEPPAEKIRPVIRPRGPQLALILMAGLFNGLILQTEKGAVAIRSVIRQEERKVEDGSVNSTDEDDEDTDDEDSIDREVYRTQSVVTLTLIDEQGDTEEISGDAAIGAFIKTHRKALMQYLDETFAPLYNFNYEKLAPILNRSKYGKLYETQKHVIAAAHAALEHRKAVYIVGEPGTGKTILAATLAATFVPKMQQGQVTIVMCPPHLVRKWEREVREVGIPTNVAILENVADVTTFMKKSAKTPKGTLNLGVISRERAKLGEGWNIAINWRTRRIARWKPGEPPPLDSKTNKPLTGNRITTIREPICPCCGKTVVADDNTSHATSRSVGKERLNNAGRPHPYPKRLNADELDQLGDKATYPVIPRPKPAYRATNLKSQPAEGAEDKLDDKKTYTKKKDKKEKQEQQGVVADLAWIKKIPRFCPSCKSALWTKARTFSDPSRIAERKAKKQTKGKKTELIELDVNLSESDLAKIAHTLERSSRREKRDAKMLPPVPLKNPRTPLAHLIAQRYANRLYMFIPDECHECKSESTDQGEAMSVLANAAQKNVPLTGTLYGGTASSLFMLELTFNPRVQKKYPWGIGKTKWIRTMGTLERIIEYKPEYDEAGIYSGKVRHEHRPKEAPGCSPLLLAEIIDHAIFVGLKDMGRKMPPFEEIPVPIDPGSDIRDRYETAKTALGKYLFQCRLEGDSSALGMYLQALLSWPDAPYRTEECIHNKPITKGSKTYTPINVCTIPALSKETLFPKEQWLIDTLNAEIEQNRGVAIFVRQTGQKRDIQGRIESLIRKHCPLAKPYILRQKVKTTERESVLANQIQHGVNVLICNPKLVETGLDLIAFPSIIFFEPVYSLYVMSQASRRAWRLIQNDDCKVFYPFYKGLMEHKAIDLVGRKQKAAALLYGEDTGVGLSALTSGGSGDLLAELAKEIGHETIDTDLRSLFARHSQEINPDDSAWLSEIQKTDNAISDQTPASIPTHITQVEEDIEEFVAQPASAAHLIAESDVPQPVNPNHGNPIVRTSLLPAQSNNYTPLLLFGPPTTTHPKLKSHILDAPTDLSPSSPKANAQPALVNEPQGKIATQLTMF